MEIHRFSSNEMEWTSDDRKEYGVKIKKQTWLSMFAMLLSVSCLVYVIYNLL